MRAQTPSPTVTMTIRKRHARLLNGIQEQACALLKTIQIAGSVDGSKRLTRVSVGTGLE